MRLTKHHIGWTAAAAAVAAGLALVGGGGEARAGRAPSLTDLSEAGLTRYAAQMDPASLALVRRHDPAGRPDLWDRPTGWASLDISEAPRLAVFASQALTPQEVNALLPFADEAIRPMRPFVLPANGAERERALHCLTQAVYYEAAREPLDGQRAVAQTVLNRLRHPAYPNSVCGVVYQGSARATGCQFTFTCDGSLRWAPEPALWRQARRVAEDALSGHVASSVGSATHYHADYVAPYWAPTLVKLTQVGTHIFYRWTGPWGQPAAFTDRYGGGEARLSAAVLGGTDAGGQGLIAPEAQGLAAGRTVELAVGGEVRTYTVADGATGDPKTRVAGTLQPVRRRPTADEVKKINESLAELEGRLGGSASGPAAEAAPAS